MTATATRLRHYMVGPCTIELSMAAGEDLPPAVAAPWAPFGAASGEATADMHVEIAHGAAGRSPARGHPLRCRAGNMHADAWQDGRGNQWLNFSPPAKGGGRAAAVELEAKRGFGDFRISTLGSFDELPRPVLPGVLMAAYSFAASRRALLVVHASAVVYRGRAILFLGPSGVGKSTHSQLWLRATEGCELLNDDNPVVGLTTAGPWAYGSPWSGKTPCYKRLCAPIAAVVRLRRGAANEMRPLGGAEAYAAILESCNALRCNAEAYGATLATAAKIAEGVAVYELKNLPTTEAAELCRATICNNGKL